MVIGKVIGEIVSSVKVDRLIGQKFLLVEIQYCRCHFPFLWKMMETV